MKKFLPILIESQWNLKMRDKTDEEILADINRITVEFKVNDKLPSMVVVTILIESQWNLKNLYMQCHHFL